MGRPMFMHYRMRSRLAAALSGVAALAVLLAGCGSKGPATEGAPAPEATGTVWLCLPGMAGDPCTSPLGTTVVTAAGSTSMMTPKAAAASPFDCFYVYGTVSRESSVNADLKRGPAEIAAARAVAQFSPLCAMYAPVYRQVTVAGLAAHPDLDLGSAESVTAYDSIKSGF